LLFIQPLGVKNMPEFKDVYESLNRESLADDERKKMQSLLLVAAKSKPDEFRKYIYSIPLDKENNLFEVYEALSEEPAAWLDFMVGETRRLLTAAEGSMISSQSLGSLEALALFGKNPDETFISNIRRELVNALDSKCISSRRWAAWLLGDFLDGDRGTAGQKLQSLLLEDSDWRVRNFSYYALRDNELLPAGYQQPFLDKIRKKVMSEFVY
jgi:hypothetical protein